MNTFYHFECKLFFFILQQFLYFWKLCLITVEGSKQYNRNPIFWIESFHNVSEFLISDPFQNCTSQVQSLHLCLYNDPSAQEWTASSLSRWRITFSLHLLTHFFKGKEFRFQNSFFNSIGIVRTKRLQLSVRLSFPRWKRKIKGLSGSGQHKHNPTPPAPVYGVKGLS